MGRIAGERKNKKEKKRETSHHVNWVCEEEGDGEEEETRKEVRDTTSERGDRCRRTMDAQ